MHFDNMKKIVIGWNYFLLYFLIEWLNEIIVIVPCMNSFCCIWPYMICVCFFIWNSLLNVVVFLQISYDLGCHFFLIRNYEKANSSFGNCKEFIDKVMQPFFCMSSMTWPSKINAFLTAVYLWASNFIWAYQHFFPSHSFLHVTWI